VSFSTIKLKVSKLETFFYCVLWWKNSILLCKKTTPQANAHSTKKLEKLKKNILNIYSGGPETEI
jgi:hypothetical protein